MVDYRVLLFGSGEAYGESLRSMLEKKGCQLISLNSNAKALTKDQLTGFHLAFIQSTKRFP